MTIKKNPAFANLPAGRQGASVGKQNSKVFIIVFLIICLAYYLFKLITSSVFLKGRDKVNVVFYGERTNFYSLDRKNINYLMTFSNVVRVIVPGGYGKYKVGAMGKLASLENNPEILRRTFSAMTSTLVDIYFFQKKTSIYYNNSKPKSQPSMRDILFAKSNANFIDRLILYNIFLTYHKESFQVINLSPFESIGDNSEFDYNSFYKKFQGSFFQRSFRSSDINVQIRYIYSYKTAKLISQIIEGEGIRVVDIDNQDIAVKGCFLISKKEIMNTKTYQRLADFFKCHQKIGETTVSDIILELGDLEKDWAVN